MKKFIYMSAKWCQPCKMLGPTMASLNSEGFAVDKVDIDSNPDLASQYGVRSIPTVILIKDGKEVSRKVGNQTKESYINMWNNS